MITHLRTFAVPTLRNHRHDLVAHEVAKGASYTDAHSTVYGRHDRQRAHEICSTDAFKARIAELRSGAVEMVEVEVARVLREMVCRAFYNVADFYQVGADGKPVLKPLDELSDDQQRALDAQTRLNADGTQTTRFKLADKDKALDQLARHLQMFRGTVVVENVFRVIQEMSDEELDRRIRELEDALAENEPWSNGPGELTRH